MPRTTVVIVTKNRRPLLEEAVASALAQAPERPQVVVVDDASSDGTWAWLERQAGRGVLPLRLERGAGRTAARNRGLAHASGETVLFLDDDDRLLPGALARLRAALDRHPRAVLAAGAKVVFNQHGRRRGRHHPYVPLTREVLPEMVWGWAPLGGQCLMRTERAREVGGYNERLTSADDHDILLRLARLGPVTLLPRPVLAYRMHQGQRRPAGADAILEGVLAGFAARLGGAERAMADQVLAARARWLEAAAAHRQGRYREALAGQVEALRSVPFLVRSPVVGPHLAATVARTAAAGVLGGRVTAGLRQARNRARRALRRDVRPVPPVQHGPDGGAPEPVRKEGDAQG